MCVLNRDSEDATAENRVRKKKLFPGGQKQHSGDDEDREGTTLPWDEWPWLTAKSSQIRKTVFEETAKGDSECLDWCV